LQAGKGVVAGFLGVTSKTERYGDGVAAADQIDLTGQRDVAIGGTRKGRVQSGLFLQLLPSVGNTDIASGCRPPTTADGKSHRDTARARRKKHRCALVVLHPARIAVTGIDQMWSGQQIETIIADRAFQRLE